MCVALPGKVIEVRDGAAKIDFSGNIVNAMAGLVELQPGDYALVHAGCVIQKMSEAEAKDMEDIFALANGNL